MNYITFHWYALSSSGVETCYEKDLEKEKEFLKKVFGAYRFETIENRRPSDVK